MSGTLVASAMNSTTSMTCVQLASLLSRTPNCAEIVRPLPQIARKPASSAIRAERPLWASQMNVSSADESSSLNRVVFFNPLVLLNAGDPSEIHTDDTIGGVEIGVVMGDDDHG